MKFKDVQTLESLVKSLSEYGSTPGPSSYGANKTSSVTAQSSSPTTTQTHSNVEPDTAPTIKPVPAKGLEDGTDFKDEKGEVAGTVISKVGSKPKPDQVVVQLPDGKYELYDPELEVMVDEDISHTALNKIKNNDQRYANSSAKRIKRLARKNQLREQGDEQLFEINFNTKQLVTKALDLPIKCGFEAETVWESYSNNDSNYGEEVDDMSWSDIEDRIFDEYGRSYLDDINEAYRNWILEDKIYEYEGDLIAELAKERKEDEAYIEEFIDSSGGPTEYAVERRKEDLKDSDPAEYKSRIEDGWEYINWLREIVEEEMEDEFIEWLEQDIRDNGEIFDAAMEAAEEDLSIPDWVSDSWGSMSEMLGEFEVYISNDTEGGLEGVADELRNWAENSSQSDNIEVGEYHSGGINNDYWRVEDDSSIEGDGAGAELISPVYRTPRAMLEEIKSLFDSLSTNSVETNRSTGLHVTMSLDPTQTGMTASAEVNKVKLAVLLGDKYLASTFGRENNSYAKSQYERLEKKAVELKADPTNTKTIEAIEQILETGISSDKFSSINFKNQSDNQSGYNLIEFRIAGGHDYHLDMPKIVKSVVRYAETLSAAYTDEHRADYIRALFKLINNVGKISTDMEDRVKGRYEELDHPVVDVLKGFFAKDHYMESVGTLARAFQNLNSYKDGTGVNADAEWEQQVAHWEKQTGETHERLKEDPPLLMKGKGLMKPHKRPPSVNAHKYLSEAQDMFTAAVAQAGYDLNQNLNREQVNAKAIGVLRKTLPEFELTYETLSDKVNRNYRQIEFGRGSADEETKFSRVKNGVDRLFKKDIIAAPEFLSELQVEKIISGIWNAINTEEGNSSKDKALVTAVVNASQNTVDSDVERVLGYTDTNKPQDYINLKRLISGGRGDWFTVGNTIQGNDYDTLIKELKKYPDWEHPVPREHDARTTGSDNTYAHASARKMLDKLQSRMNALSNLRNTDPELYINSLKQMFNASKQLLKQAGHNYETSGGNPYTFSMSSREHDRIIGLIKDIEASNYVPDPFSEQPATAVFSHIKSWLDDQLTVHSYGNELDSGDTKAKYKARTNAVAKWLSALDTISQKLGFDSQKDAIDNKLNQVQKGKDFQIATHGEYKASITVFNYGGDVYATNSLNAIINNTDNMDDWSVQYLQDFYSSFNFNSSMFKSADSRLLIIPHAHYFIALEALEHKADGSFRDSKAEDILRKFRNVYGISIQDLASEYTKVHIRKLKQMGVQVIEKGDGREGLPPYNFAPLLPRAEINAPNGEPFEKSSAAAWLVNNPEKANQSVPTGDMDDHFAKARDFYPAFDEMMAQGMQNFMRSGKPVNDLVNFLNNSGNTSAMKAAVLQAIHNNRDGGRGSYGSPLTFDQALNLGLVLNGGWQGNNESVSTTFEKLEAKTLSEQLLMLEKIDSSKINNIHSKLFEASLSRGELAKDQYRLDNFIKKVEAGEPFVMVDGSEVVLHPDMIKDVQNAYDIPDPKDIDGNKISWSKLAKTEEFGSREAVGKVSNKGEVAEGILGCATFARLLKRPNAPITDSDVKAVMQRLPKDAPDKGGWHEITLTAQEIDNPIADFFTLTLNLKSDAYNSFIDPAKWSIMDNISANVVLYVNDNLKWYSELFARNGKVDAVKVIADGVTGETDTKVDVFLTHSLDGGPEKTLQHFDMSVKTGTTKQMGQVGGGKRKEGVSQGRFFILKEMFEKFGADLSTIEQQFMSSNSIEDSYDIAYREAAKQINYLLTTKEKEEAFLIQLLDSIKFFATLNDDRVKLVQFTDTLAGGYYVLDFKKLDRMFDKDKVDLEAQFIENAAHPKITIFNTKNKKPFLSIRKKQAKGGGYIRNYIEKEKGLVELIKVRGTGMRKKVESVQEQSSSGISIHNQHKIPDILKYLSGVKNIQNITSADLIRDLHSRFGLLAYEARYVISMWHKKKAGIKEGAVPNNDTIRKLRQVLASPILTGDLKAQMTAYVCIPDPAMIRDFRAARAAYGDKHDIRSIVQGYAKMKLNKNVLKQL